MPIPNYTVAPAGLAAARPTAGTPGRLYYSTDTQVLERDNGSTWETYAGGTGGGGLFESYCCVIDQKALGTNGGAFTLGAWRTRDINTEVYDPDGIVALAANQITLDAGDYLCIASAPAYNVTRNQARLYNVTDGALLILGSSEDTTAGATPSQTRSKILGRFTIGAAKAIEIQHYSSATQALNGFGVAGSFGVEVYAVAEFWKEI